VRTLNTTKLKPETLKALITADGGDLVPPDF
jgi:hypothetical protein